MATVSILSRPEERLQRLAQLILDAHVPVSILSRPEERLQPGLGEGDLLVAVDVSILSRPEERLQLQAQSLNACCS